MKRLDDAVATTLSEAVRDLERKSSAEVVIDIRRRSGSYAHADVRFAALLSFSALAVLLYSPWPVAPAWVLIDVAAVWGFGLFVSRRSDAVRRWMTTSSERQRAARLSAAAAFHDRGIANTSSESGVLVFLSLLERRLEVVADRGVLEAVPSLEWNRFIQDARSRAGTLEWLLEVIRVMTPLLGRYLQWREGDADELGNMPRFEAE